MQGHVCDRLVVHGEGLVKTDQRGEMRIVLYEGRLRAGIKRTLHSASDGVGRAEMKCFTVPSQTFVCVSGFFSVQICVFFLVQVNFGITDKTCMLFSEKVAKNDNAS